MMEIGARVAVCSQDPDDATHKRPDLVGSIGILQALPKQSSDLAVVQMEGGEQETVKIRLSNLSLVSCAPVTHSSRADRSERSEFFKRIHEGTPVFIQHHPQAPAPRRAIVTVPPRYPSTWVTVRMQDSGELLKARTSQLLIEHRPASRRGSEAASDAEEVVVVPPGPSCAADDGQVASGATPNGEASVSLSRSGHSHVATLWQPHTSGAPAASAARAAPVLRATASARPSSSVVGPNAQLPSQHQPGRLRLRDTRVLSPADMPREKAQGAAQLTIRAHRAEARTLRHKRGAAAEDEDSGRAAKRSAPIRLATSALASVIVLPAATGPRSSSNPRSATPAVDRSSSPDTLQLYAEQILPALMHHSHAWPFVEPLDGAKLECHPSLKEPVMLLRGLIGERKCLALNHVLARVQQGKYTSALDASTEIRRLFGMCYTRFAQHEAFVEHTIQLELELDRLVERICSVQGSCALENGLQGDQAMGSHHGAAEREMCGQAPLLQAQPQSSSPASAEAGTSSPICDAAATHQGTAPSSQGLAGDVGAHTRGGHENVPPKAAEVARGLLRETGNQHGHTPRRSMMAVAAAGKAPGPTPESLARLWDSLC